MMYEEKPTRCISPVVKLCQDCPWGWVEYPEWVETAEDLEWCTIKSGCTLGYEHDEPTEEELKEFEEWTNRMYGRKDDEIN
jgi:hypothetical protein